MIDHLPQRQRIEVCPTCALPFSFPLDFYLLRSKNGGSVHCPAGHTISLAEPKTAANAVLLAIDLQSQIKQLQAELEHTRAVLARMPQPPEGPITDAEFVRRVELLTHRAEKAEYGKSLCRFCGKIQGGTGKMRRHLRECHRDAIIQLPAVTFD